MLKSVKGSPARKKKKKSVKGKNIMFCNEKPRVS